MWTRPGAWLEESRGWRRLEQGGAQRWRGRGDERGRRLWPATATEKSRVTTRIEAMKGLEVKTIHARLAGREARLVQA
jgi:hypothetical protein